MGVNMRILHCYGVKVEKLDSIPADKVDEYQNNFWDLDFKSECYKPVIFDDCYGGGWEFFGEIIEYTHDFRYDGWDVFEWEIGCEDDYKHIDELCEQYSLGKPKHYVLTYYS